MISGQTDEYDPFSTLGQNPRQLTDELMLGFETNVIGNIHLFNLFMPLVLKGTVKKVVTISTGMADIDIVVNYGVYEGGPYSISKAAMNMAAAKFQAEYQKDGVLFVSISPGVVETGRVPHRKLFEHFNCAGIHAD
jgi:NAD(P)-dependent dehydrogenase (short-subunit alcohol dehydrogenase family)